MNQSWLTACGCWLFGVYAAVLASAFQLSHSYAGSAFVGRFGLAPALRTGLSPELKYAVSLALTKNQLNAYPTSAAAVRNALAELIAAGSLNAWNPIAESASCRYVERRW